VIVVSMFQGLAAGWADLVLPGTSYLEREGTYVNLEGRLQRLRQTAAPPAPMELEWIAELARRFGVDVSPYPAKVFEEVSERCFGGLRYGEVGERAPLRGYAEAPPHVEAPPVPEPYEQPGGIHLVAYKPLFSGAAVERVPELQFQRPQAEVEVSDEDARRLGLATGDAVRLSAGDAAATLRVRVSSKVRTGIARAPQEHVNGLQGRVEIAAEVTA
jgi:predicted molibdopterin-dependent oxidoreductase YjgC